MKRYRPLPRWDAALMDTSHLGLVHAQDSGRYIETDTHFIKRECIGNQLAKLSLGTNEYLDTAGMHYNALQEAGMPIVPFNYYVELTQLPRNPIKRREAVTLYRVAKKIIGTVLLFMADPNVPGREESSDALYEYINWATTSQQPYILSDIQDIGQYMFGTMAGETGQQPQLYLVDTDPYLLPLDEFRPIMNKDGL